MFVLALGCDLAVIGVSICFVEMGVDSVLVGEVALFIAGVAEPKLRVGVKGADVGMIRDTGGLTTPFIDGGA